MYDDTPHPDLTALGGTLRARFDAVLEAERRAAVAAARRGSTIRDRLLELEDEGGSVAVALPDGTRVEGVVVATAADHVEIAGPARTVLVPLRRVAAIEFP